MVGVAMAVDHGPHWPFRTVTQVEVKRGTRRFAAGKGVDDDQSRIALDDRHVGQIKAAHLIDALGDLEQSVDQVQSRLPPQCRMRCRRGHWLVKEGIVFKAPDQPAVLVTHFGIRHRANESAPGVGLVAMILVWQPLQRLSIGRHRGCGCGTGWHRYGSGRSVAMRHGVVSGFVVPEQASSRYSGSDDER
ncbi:hypothetical protein D9M72_411800 [compost metagenome]